MEGLIYLPNWQEAIMILIGLLPAFFAVYKKYEPLLFANRQRGRFADPIGGDGQGFVCLGGHRNLDLPGRPHLENLNPILRKLNDRFVTNPFAWTYNSMQVPGKPMEGESGIGDGSAPFSRQNST